MLVLAGSVLNHLAVLSPRLWIEWLALLVLAAAPLANGLLARRGRSFVWLLLAAGAAALLVRMSGGALALYLPSVALPALLAWLFGRSLLADRIPLVVIIARATDRQLPDNLVAYARHLTQMWFLLFVAMLVVDAGLALSSRRELWSLVANFGNYLLIGLVVFVEYVYRRWRFGDYQHPGFIDYLRILLRANPRQMS